MKKSNTSATGEDNSVEPKVDTSRKTREQYRKEIVENKKKVQDKPLKHDGDECQEEQGDSKFKELKRYLLSDIATQGVKGSSPVKTGSSPVKTGSSPVKTGSSPVKTGSSGKGSRTPRKNMIDTRTELPTAQPNVTATGDSVVNKKSPSPRKKSSPATNGTKPSPLTENGSDDSPSKKSKGDKSQEKLNVPTPESPRTGNRQRSPNLRYADDMVMFPIKSPKRQIFRKDSDKNLNSGQQPKSADSLSSESQTSQLYSLLTGTVVNAPTCTSEDTEKLLSKQTKTKEKVNDKPDVKEENVKLCEEDLKPETEDQTVSVEKGKSVKSELNAEESNQNKGVNHVTTVADVKNDSESGNKESSDSAKETDKKSEIVHSEVKNEVDINCNSDEKEKSSTDSTDAKVDPMANVVKVIDQILVEAVQEETPVWATYNDITEKYRIKPKKAMRRRSRSKVGLDELNEEDNLSGDGGDSDDGAKRRLTRPISKSSMIRMTPALGVLVGHDEEGFMVLHKRKKQKSWNKGKGPEKYDIDAGHLAKKEDGKIQSAPKLQSLLPSKTDVSVISKAQSSVLSGNKPVTTQAAIKVIGPQGIVGTKATLVSGSQNVPCVIVPATTGQPTLISLPMSGGLVSKNNILIPASQISLIPTSPGAIKVSQPMTQSTNMVSMLQGSAVKATVTTSSSNIRPRVASPGSQQPTLAGTPRGAVTSIVSPRPGTLFRLSSTGHLISSTGQPLLSTKVQPGIVGNIPCTQSTLVTNKNTLGVATSKTMKPNQTLSVATSKGIIPGGNQKVLILKKSDINTSKSISIQVSSPGMTCVSSPGITGGIVTTGQKSPIRSIAPSLKPKIGNTTTTVSGQIDSKPSIHIKEESEENNPKPVTKTSTSEIDLNESKPIKTLIMESGKSDSNASQTSSTSENIPLVSNSTVKGTKTECEEIESNADPKIIVTENKQMDSNATNTNSNNESEQLDSEAPSTISGINNEQTESKPTSKTQPVKKDDSVLTNLISKIQNNISSVPEILGSLMDDRQTTTSETNGESESDSDEEIDFSKFFSESDDNDKDSQESGGESISAASSQSAEPSLPTTEKKSILEVMEKSIESEMQNEFEKEENKQERHKNSVKNVEKVDGRNTCTGENEQLIDDKNNANVSDSEAKLDSQSKSEHVSEAMEENLQEKHKLADVHDSAKDQSETLQSKIKKAMESISNVKSLLASKTQASKLKPELKSESTPLADNNEQDLNGSKGTSSNEQNDKMGVLAEENDSDLDDHGERRNIFDVMMKDYQSPNKDGKCAENTEETKPEGGSSEKMQVDEEAQEKSNENKLEGDMKTIPVSSEKDSNSKSVSENLSQNSEDLIPAHNNTNKLKDTPLMSKLLESKGSSSPVVLSSDDGNDSDIQIIKVQGGNESESENEKDEKMTIADKLLAKFKKWEEENNAMKTPTKQPLKLKITSSPDKSFIVSSHGRKRKADMRKVDGRFVPKNSTQREVKEPLPMAVLLNPEREVTDKLSAFHSEYLDNFLIHQNSVEDDEDEEEDEDDNIDDNMSDMSMDENEPDFEEIDGILFMSFPSKNALNAHVQVERRTKLGSDENLMLGMARMRNLKRKQGYILSKYNKRVGNEFFKKQDNISQNLRGMHKTLAKYQRLYKQEMHSLELQREGGSKTNDITKIKGWKSKVGSVNDDVEQAIAEIENGGKLHWRTEARLAKNLKPDELKEIGLKKKRRKNIIYTQRKGMSKGDRSLRLERDEAEGDISRGGSPIQFIEDDIEVVGSQMDEMDDSQMTGREDIGEDDEAIVFDPDDAVQDEELIRIQERELLKEDEHRKTRERNRIIFKTTMLKKRMNYSLQDIQVIRKLGGHNIRRRKDGSGAYTGPYTVMDERGSRPSTPDVTHSEEADTPHKKISPRTKETLVVVLTSSMANAACSALPKQFVRYRQKVKDVPTTPRRSSDQAQSITCDKPDTTSSKNESCRYGCICHLCMFTEQSPEADQKVVKCEKEYCRLGCICDSIEARKDKTKIPKCGKPGCIPECICGDCREQKGMKDDKDYIPSAQKGNPKYNTLPRRQSTYRLAKNLDAVSRKAMLYYESSEMYADQKKARRRRSKDSLDMTPDMTPEVYMDVDIDDEDPDQSLQTGSTPLTRLEAELKKPTYRKPKSLMTSEFIQHKRDMTDFSNIKSEISSQGSWNVDDLSDEYDEVEVVSDGESSRCARTTVYNTAHREKHCASGCTCGTKKSGSTLSPNDDGKFNIPKEILLSGKWHTQWICLRSKGQSADDKYMENLRLLEVISNCDYEDMKAKILSNLTTHIALSSYPPLRTFVIEDFCVSILPKSNCPAVIPPEVKAKLPDSVYSIRVQIVKHYKFSSKDAPVINLTNDNEDKEAPKETPSRKKKRKKEVSIKQEIGQSELAKRLQNATTSNSIVPGGISGLSRLQISCPTGPVKIAAEQNSLNSTVSFPTIPVPPKTAGQVHNMNVGAGSVVLLAKSGNSAVTVTRPISVVASGSSLTSTAVTSMTNQPIFLVQETGGIVKGKVVGLPVAANSASPMITTTSAIGKPIPPIFVTQPQNVVGQSNDGPLKRKVPWQAVNVNSDVKRSKVESSLLGVEGQTPIAHSGIVEPVEPVSVLRCVRCNAILTTEDITSWVLSQESVSEKICVKCRGINPSIVRPTLLSEPNPATPIVIDDTDPPDATSKGSKSPCIDLTEGSELIKSVENEANKIRTIVQDVDDSSITSFECSKSNSSCQDPGSEPVIDLSDDNNDEGRKESQQEGQSKPGDMCDKGTGSAMTDTEKQEPQVSKSDNTSKGDMTEDDITVRSSTVSGEVKAEGDITKSSQSVTNEAKTEGEITKSSQSVSDEAKSESSNADANLKADTEDEYDAAVLDAQDEDNIAHSHSDDEKQEAAQEKSNVIVIDDEDEAVSEDDDIDVTSYSESDSINIIPDSDTSISSQWHHSSCSLNRHIRRKRKAQMEAIPVYNNQTNQMESVPVYNMTELKEEKEKEDVRMTRVMKNRNRRYEEDKLFRDLAMLVLQPIEFEQMPAMNKTPARTVVLDKAIEHLQEEDTKAAQLKNKVKTFKQYQLKLLNRLENLKEFHIKRGISKEKLDFQLDKIAVVCDRIYDHLPEIKQHIKSKKEGDSSGPSTPQGSKGRDRKMAQQWSSKDLNNAGKTQPNVGNIGNPEVSHSSKSRRSGKKAKAANPPIQTAEISNSNSIDYDNSLTASSTFITAGTSLNSLPGIYSSSTLMPTQVIPNTSGTVSPLVTAPVRVVKYPVSSNQSASNLSEYKITFPVRPILNPPIRPPLIGMGSRQVAPPVTVNNQFPLSTVVCADSNVQGSGTVVSNTQTLAGSSSDALPVLVEGSVTSLSTQSEQCSEQPTEVKGQTQAQSTRQHSPTDFRSIIGKIIKKNVIESQDSIDEELEESDVSENNVLLSKENIKDQILDDTTGEIISVVINEDVNDSSNDSVKISENTLSSVDVEKSSEVSSKTEDDSKSSENDNISKTSEKTVHDDNESPTEKTVLNDESSVAMETEMENKDEEPNIESLLDDIRALSQEDSSETKSSPIKSSQSVSGEPSCTKNDTSVKHDQVDGDIFNLSDNKESVNNPETLSDADSNNSARTNVYMEDSDGNISIAGDIADDLRDNSPKVVSVMSLSDVIDDNC